MFLAEADASRGVLRITVAQHVEPEDISNCLESLQSLLADMRPGFRLITDLSGLESMAVSCAPYIGRLMELWTRKGVESVFRILPPEANRDIGYGILSQFYYGPDVSIVTCDNLKEATRLLGEEYT